MPRNKPKITKKQLMIWAFAAALVIGLIFLIFSAFRWFIFKNPFFEVQKIETIGADIPKSYIFSLHGQNIFSINLKELYLSLRGKYPYAKEISIIKKLPNEIDITITQRIPVLVIKKGRAIYPVDEMGMVLPSTQTLPRAKILRVIINDEKAVAPGKFIKEEGLFLAIDLIKALEETKLINVIDFSYIDAREPYELRLYLKNKSVWKMRTKDYKNKLALFKKMMLDSYLESAKQAKKGSYLLFLDDGTITTSL